MLLTSNPESDTKAEEIRPSIEIGNLYLKCCSSLDDVQNTEVEGFQLLAATGGQDEGAPHCCDIVAN